MEGSDTIRFGRKPAQTDDNDLDARLPMTGTEG
jgi:hypothetical protein